MIHWRRDRLPTPVFLGFPGSSAGKESACNAGDLGSNPGLARYPGEGKGYPLQHSDLENQEPCIVHGVAKSWTQLSDFHHHYCPIHVTTKTKNVKKETSGFSFKKTASVYAQTVIVFVLVAESCPALFATSSTLTRQAPLFSCLFTRQEY